MRNRSTRDNDRYEVVTVGDLAFLYNQRVQDGVTWVRFGVPRQAGVERPALACVTFVVGDDEQEDIALEWVGYRPDCSEPDLPEVSGSAEMLRAAIGVVFARFPGRDGIRFSDTSRLNRCYEALAPRASRASVNPRLVPPDAAPVPVPLSYHGILLHGQTWYQRHFGARPVSRWDSDPESKLEGVRSALAAQRPTADGSFERFWADHVLVAPGSAHGRWLDGPSGVREAARACWEATSGGSWHAFYRCLNDAVGCGVFAPIIDSVLRAKPPEGLDLNMISWQWRIARDAHDAGASVGGGRRGAPPAQRRAADALFAASDRLRDWETVGNRPPPR